MTEAINLRPVLTFRLANQHYAIAIEQVLEVAAMVALTTLPDAPPEVLGIANRHGEVLPIVDLRKVFRLPAAEITVATLFIVTEIKEQRIGLVVDEVFQVKYIMEEALKPTHSSGKYVKYLVSDGESLFQLIDANPLLALYLPTR